MKNLAPPIVLACILILMLPIVAFGQHAAKGLLNPPANVQNALTYESRGFAKQKKGDLNGAIADYDQARLSSSVRNFPYPARTRD
jgi:hypothetical protein